MTKGSKGAKPEDWALKRPGHWGISIRVEVKVKISFFVKRFKNLDS